MALQMLVTGALSTLEPALNRVLARDPVTLDRLGEMAGRIVAVEVTAPSLQLYLIPHAEGIDLLAHYAGDADVTLKGSAVDLARLPQAGNEVLFGQGVTISGDSALAHRLQKVLADTRIDWEAWISDWLGDTAGHEAAKLIRSLGTYGRDSSRSMLMNLQEYVQEEARLLPTPVEVEIFMDEVDTLRERTDRLLARIDRLETSERLNNHKDQNRHKDQ
ncbi:MAG: hypothetical protein CMI01_04180 [Oceanospirillaceae bacterium]|jgi:ubiquinone biosynthesis protein UbiJ|nr:hypothetical protein [Oceanospirillaceae bacterium]